MNSLAESVEHEAMPKKLVKDGKQGVAARMSPLLAKLLKHKGHVQKGRGVDTIIELHRNRG